MALYKVDFAAVFNNEDANPFNNVFFYNTEEVLPSSVTATSLADAFADNVIEGAEGWVNVVVVSMVSDSVVVTSPYDPTVLGIRLTAAPGVAVGNASPRFNAWGLKAQRKRADMRAGFKRFGVISETDTQGQVPSAGALTRLNTLAGIMGAPLEVSDGVQTYDAFPVIVKRIPVIVGGETVGYRLPTSDLELVSFIADNWAFQAITSQNSRKP